MPWISLSSFADDHAEQRRLFAIIEEMPPARTRSARGHLGASSGAARHARAGGGAVLLPGASEDRPRRGRRKSGRRDARTRSRTITRSGTRRRPSIEHEAGLGQWFKAVAAANKANSDHMAEEERQGLTDFRRHADRDCVIRLASQFIRFESEHLTGDRREAGRPRTSTPICSKTVRRAARDSPDRSQTG